MDNVLFAAAGLIIGGIINALADVLPVRRKPSLPRCWQCAQPYGTFRWLAVGRLVGGGCPHCGARVRARELAVELGTMVLFSLIPLLISPVGDAIIYSLYVAVLVLIIVTDVEHRLVLHVVTFPATAFALLASMVLTDSTLANALVGTATGFILFYLAYLLGSRLFGRGALGFGDVTLSMTMGAMVGFDGILFALVIGILLAGAWSLIALLTRRMSRRSYFAYGPFLAIGGIIVIFFGSQMTEWILR